MFDLDFTISPQIYRRGSFSCPQNVLKSKKLEENALTGMLVVPASIKTQADLEGYLILQVHQDMDTGDVI